MKMRRRVFGAETEYGVSMVRAGKSVMGDDHIYRMMTAACGTSVGITGGVVKSRFLTNGSRCYLDVGNHPEYATPECDDPIELVHHVVAGDRYLAGVAQAYENSYNLQAEGPPLAIALYKNNLSGYANPGGETPFGSHENYQVRAEKPEELAPFLMAYFVTRQLVLGAGRLRLDSQRQPYFELSQRSGFTTDDTSPGTTTTKPIFNTRNEPHMAPGHIRLHVVHGDNNVQPQLTAIKFALMDVLLTLFEEGRARRLELNSPIRDIKRISQIPQTPISIVGRRDMNALQIQRFYWDQAWKLVSSDSEFAAKRPLIAAYGAHLDRLDRSYHPADHVGYLDWATKQQLLEVQFERHPERFKEATYEEARLSYHAAELSYHQITGQRTLHKAVMRRYGSLDETAVARAAVLPPRTTRAWARGALLRDPRHTGVDWSWVKFGAQAVKLLDPLNPAIPPIPVPRVSGGEEQMSA